MPRATCRRCTAALPPWLSWCCTLMSQSEQIIPIDAVARANGVRPTQCPANLPFFIFPLECPTRRYIRRPHRGSPWRSVPFSSPSFHTCRLNIIPRLAIIGSRLGLSRNKTFIAGTSESAQAPVPTRGQSSYLLHLTAFPLPQNRLLGSSSLERGVLT